MHHRIEIRPIQSLMELDQACELWGEVFPENKAFFQKRLELEPEYDLNTTWIAKVDGRLAASVQIFPYYIAIGDTILKVGGIGNVATHPEYRGMGLTHTILKRQTEWMDRNGFDLSLLSTGINAFYEKLGWQTFEEKSLTLTQFPELSQVGYDVSVMVDQDLEQIKDLYKEFSNQFIGPRIRSSSYWELAMKNGERGRLLVAKKNDRVVAYLRYQGEEDIRIQECCYRDGDEKAVLSLLKEILNVNRDVKQIQINCAKKHVLTLYFQEWQAEESKLTHSMWKVINLDRLLERLRTSFTNKIQAIKNVKDYTMLLRCGNSDFLFSLGDGILDIRTPTELLFYDELFKCSDSEFIQLLLNGAESKIDNELVKSLFADGYYQFWGNDSF